MQQRQTQTKAYSASQAQDSVAASETSVTACVGADTAPNDATPCTDSDARDSKVVAP